MRVALDAEHGKEKMRRATVRTGKNRRTVKEAVKLTVSPVEN
jgi:hypothetical protein